MPTLEPPAIPQLRLRTDVFLVDAPDGTGWLLDLRGSFFALNPTGLQLLRAALTHDELRLKHIAATGGTSTERVRNDQQALIAMLVARQLLTVAGRPLEPPPRWAKCLWRSLIGPHPKARHYSRLLALNWFFFKRLGWQRTVELMQSCVRRAEGNTSVKVDALRWSVARSLLWVGCKERALAAAAVAWANGQSATVVLGVCPFPLASHAWCEVAGQVVTDPPDRIEPFIRVATYT